MSKSFRKGDKVTWNTPQGTTHGTVERKLTSRTNVKGQEIAATKDEPRYLVRSDKSGEHAAHKGEALERRE
jgi:hypothetical protein